MKTFIYLVSGSLFLGCLITSCSPSPKPINFGSDLCAHCSMTITDPRFAAELVSNKGKVWKFDATECLLEHINESNTIEYAYFLVSNYTLPNELIPAQNTLFLVSPAIESPMGGHIAAFSTSAEAIEARTKIGEGDLYTWKELKQVWK